MIRQTWEEWYAEMNRLFGGDRHRFAWMCPNCGHIQTVKDFEALRINPVLARSMCIGNFVNEIGCEWKAEYGTKGEGRVIDLGYGVMEVFDFA